MNEAALAKNWRAPRAPSRICGAIQNARLTSHKMKEMTLLADER